jgi:hypothetical protein
MAGQMERWPPTELVLALEERSRRHGSGLTAEPLAGCWQLEAIWSREGRALPAQAACLRLVQAQLELKPAGSEPSAAAVDHAKAPTVQHLQLINSAQLGALRLRFLGRGELQGRRPLLRFNFTCLTVHLGPWLLHQQNLPETSAKQQPFFALIGSGHDKDGYWLLARGRGGGLARWRRP